MKRESFFFVSLVALLILGCGAPASPTPLSVESSPTTVSTLGSTPHPTATEKPATPTLTPVPGLRTNGPYFAYFQQDTHGIRRLVFMDADGIGRKVMELPKAIGEAFAVIQPPDPDIQWVSPDGKWLAFYTGSAGDPVEMPASGTFDLTLNLLELATGEEQVITPLLSKDYPNNFIEAARQLNDPNITAKYLYQAFVYGITRALAWSPDGRYLAFAGQMDGLSSDLYSYDVETRTIRRLSSGDQELQWIDWSPDGKWIMHSGVYWVGPGMIYDIYAATIDGTSAPHISANIEENGIDSWLNTHQYLEHDGENVVGLYGLRLVDVDTGRITKIWDETFDSYAVDGSGAWAAILDSPDVASETGGSNFETDFVPAVYLVNLTTLEKKGVEFPDTTQTYGSIEWSSLNPQGFVIRSAIRDAKAMFLSTDGTLTESDLGDAKIFVSPNSEYWLALTTVTGLTDQNFLVVTDQKAEIFAGDGTLLKSIPFFSLQNALIHDVVWRPGSSGLFLISGTTIFSMDLPSGNLQAIETDLLDLDATYGWINGQ